MNILIQNRPDAESAPGGDTVQMHRTAEFLRRLGHRVDISLQLGPDVREYDVIHLFNLTRPVETLAQAENARRQSKPYVLSSVYWDLEGAIPWRAYDWSQRWRIPLRAIRARLMAGPGQTGRSEHSSMKDMQSSILLHAQRVFPNSTAERDHILACFAGLDARRFVVVYNGVEPLPVKRSAANAGTSYFLCAGAIGPRKNQLGLVRAFRRLPQEKLLILGDVAPGCNTYMRAVRGIAGDNVEFHAAIPHERMPDHWVRTKVLVQPSYIETPGLSALEAAAAGIPVVVADVPPVREYFADAACYCQPASPRSIALACQKAVNSTPPRGHELVERFAWPRVLEPLGQAYAALSLSEP